MDENAKGGKTYSRIIQSVRVNNQPVGPQYHKYDEHFKKWCEGKTPEELKQLLIPPKRSKASSIGRKSLPKNEAKTISNKILTAKVKPAKITMTKEMKKAEQDKRVKEKYEQMKRQKLVDSLKSHCRCRHIKSAGNGL